MKSKTVIFDLSGTLIVPSYTQFPQEDHQALALLVFLYGGTDKTPPDVKRALEILQRIEHQRRPEDELIKLHTGQPVPPVMIRWLSGDCTARQALDHSYDQLEKETFVGSSQKETIKKMFDALFNPEILAQAMVAVYPLVEVLKKCHENENDLYIFSNWDKESLPIMKNLPLGDAVFSYFTQSQIIISAQAGALKPRPKAFEYFLEKTNLETKTAIFIDNQAENVAAAKTYGITSLLFDHNAEQIENRLREFGFIIN